MTETMIHPSMLSRSIQIFPAAARPSELDPDAWPEHSVAFVTIGLGETHVTLLDPDSRQIANWTAVFGWVCLADVLRAIGGVGHEINERLLGQAVSGEICNEGSELDTSTFVAASITLLSRALQMILNGTIGENGRVGVITLCAPQWLHPLLRCGPSSLRDNISPVFIDTP